MRSEGWKLNDAGWLEGARRVASPNFDDRPKGEAVTLLVVHAISLPPGRFGGPAIEEFFTNRLDPRGHPFFKEIESLKVSAHFLIRRDGEIVQFVSCGKRAWHAGLSNWRGRSRCNDFSLGVELEGCDEKAFEPIQYRSLARLIVALRRAHPLTDIAGHGDIAPGRKTDPGPLFDWTRLSRLLVVRSTKTIT